MFLLPLIASIIFQTSCNGLPVVTFRFYQGEWEDLANGYCLVDESDRSYFIPGIINYGFYITPSPTHFTTRALYQNEGVVEATAAYHNIDLAGRHAVSLMSPADVGRIVWIRHPDQEHWIQTIDVDAVSREHAYYHIVYADSAIELSWELADELGMLDQTSHAGIYGLEVCVADHYSVCEHSAPVDYTQWFLENVRYN